MAASRYSEVLQVGELLAQQKDVVGLQPPDDRLGERVPLGPQLPPRQLGQRPGVGFAVEQALQDLARREPAHIGDHCGELDVGVLQHRLQPIGQPCPLVDEVDTIAREVAQVTLSGRRDEARAQQPVAQQVGQPLGIFHIRLATRHRLDVVGVDDQHLALALQQVEDGPPIGPR